jgi:hypothetical protein
MTRGRCNVRPFGYTASNHYPTRHSPGHFQQIRLHVHNLVFAVPFTRKEVLESIHLEPVLATDPITNRQVTQAAIHVLNERLIVGESKRVPNRTVRRPRKLVQDGSGFPVQSQTG